MEKTDRQTDDDDGGGGGGGGGGIPASLHPRSPASLQHAIQNMAIIVSDCL